MTNIFKILERYAKKLRSLPGGRQAGFTLLLAGIVASIALSLGASIFEIAQKEVVLSAIGRDSEFAFYAADSAAECGLYWDSRFATFSNPPSSPNCTQSDPNYYGVTCDGKQACITATNVNHNGGGGGGSTPTQIFITPAGMYTVNSSDVVVPYSGSCGANCFTVPDSSGAPFTVEVIGGGGGGSTKLGGDGGGGGGYASKIMTLDPGPVTYHVGSGGVVGSAGAAGGDTYFCSSNSGCANVSDTNVIAGATGGGGGTATTGGAGGAGMVGTTLFSGGDAGTGKYSGGGGAAGKYGAGGDGDGAASPPVAGGSGDAGHGGSGLISHFGQEGCEWLDLIVCFGSGSGGGVQGIMSGYGGAYGGGGAGDGGINSTSVGADGMIVLTYGGGGGSTANLTTGTYTYRYAPNGYCAYVTVNKSLVHSATGDSIRTYIEADGYNVPCDLIASSPDALQRAVELQY